MKATLTDVREQVLLGTLARFQFYRKFPLISFLKLAGLLTAALSVIIRPVASPTFPTLVDSQAPVIDS